MKSFFFFFFFLTLKNCSPSHSDCWLLDSSPIFLHAESMTVNRECFERRQSCHQRFRQQNHSQTHQIGLTTDNIQKILSSSHITIFFPSEEHIFQIEQIFVYLKKLQVHQYSSPCDTSTAIYTKITIMYIDKIPMKIL